MSPYVLALVFVLFGAALVYFAHVQAKAAKRQWERFALETGLDVHQSWPRIAASGTWRDLGVDLATSSVPPGKDGRPRYVHTLSIRVPADIGDLQIAREGMFDAIAKPLGGQDVETRDSVFDAAFRVKCSAKAKVRAALGPRAREAMIAATKDHPRLFVAEGKLHVQRAGIPTPSIVVADLEALGPVARAFGS